MGYQRGRDEEARTAQIQYRTSNWVMGILNGPVDTIGEAIVRDERTRHINL
jgi:hypothetical protein